MDTHCWTKKMLMKTKHKTVSIYLIYNIFAVINNYDTTWSYILHAKSIIEMEPYSYSVLYLTGEIYENHGRNSDTEEAKGTVAI